MPLAPALAALYDADIVIQSADDLDCLPYVLLLSSGNPHMTCVACPDAAGSRGCGSRIVGIGPGGSDIGVHPRCIPRAYRDGLLPRLERTTPDAPPSLAIDAQEAADFVWRHLAPYYDR